MKIRVAILALGAMLSAPLQAKWYEASSDHFVIYADDSENEVRFFAENLEKYHAAIVLLTGREVEKPSPSNRLTIFVVGSQRDVRKLAGHENSNIAGFYVPRAGASRAFVQDIRNKSNGYPDFSTVVLLHEYAHHFLMTSTPYAMPRWLNEGAAEFYASASFGRDGSVQIGRPAQHRVGELRYADEVSVHELFDEELYEKNRSKGYDAFYGMSWALYHYLVFNEDRDGQLKQYRLGLTTDRDRIEVARESFGDLDQLDREIDKYLKQRKMLSFNLKPEFISYGPIKLRELPDGEAAMMDVHIVSQRGVNREQALELLEDARKIVVKYPDDPGVLTAMAEAEFDAGNDDAAIAFADRAIAIDPARPNAYVQKGFALFRKAESAEDEEAAYAEAMKAFSALNRIENDHPLPLIYYYRSFVGRGVKPSENARHALERASQLSPFDHGLAMNTALMQAHEGKIALARARLKPLALNPHGGGLAEQAKIYLDQLARVEEGTPWNPAISAIDATVELDVPPLD